MPERQPLVMRAATASERVRDRVQDGYEAAAAQPLGMLADLLGLSDLQGIVDSFSDPDAATAVQTGAAPRRVPRMGGAGKRIDPGTQSGQDSMAKIPRFRSELGTFIKHQGGWWRIPKQEAGATHVQLERLAPGKPELGQMPEVLERKVIDADTLIGGIREAKGVREPKRNAATKPRL